MNPKYAARIAELQQARLEELREARLVTAEARYRDYVRRYKGPGSPMPKDEWEAKVLGKGKGTGKLDEGDKGDSKKDYDKDKSHAENTADIKGKTKALKEKAQKSNKIESHTETTKSEGRGGTNEHKQTVRVLPNGKAVVTWTDTFTPKGGKPQAMGSYSVLADIGDDGSLTHLPKTRKKHKTEGEADTAAKDLIQKQEKGATPPKGKGKGKEKGEEKPKGEKKPAAPAAPKKAPESVPMAGGEYKALASALEGWNEPGAWEHVISYAISGKPMQGKHVDEVIGDIGDKLESWDTYAKANGWNDTDKKNLTKAKKLLEKAVSKASPKEKPAKGEKAKGKKKPADKPKKSYSKNYAKSVETVMDKYSLTDDDADEVRKHKKKLFHPSAKNRMSDQERFNKFLQMASPETKKRMMGPPKMSTGDFIAMLNAITEDEEGGGKQARQTRTASANFDLDFIW